MDQQHRLKFFLFLTFCLFFACGEAKTTVCLNMIVKNESKVIERCLNSVLPLIDTWVIVDTGSEDGTQQIIKNFMAEKGIPGELHERPWVNFGHNRTEALQLAKNKADYLFFIDADEYIEYEPDFQLPKLDKDFYYVKIIHDTLSYDKIQFINNRIPWHWVGVLHECVAPTYGRSLASVDKLTTIYTTEGARSQNPLKYQKDAEILEAALEKEPHNTRYRFYLAQSYRDAGNDLLALENYAKRGEMKGCEQEVFYSLLQVGLLQEKLKMPPEVFLKSYLSAYQQRSMRAEPIYFIANYYRREGEFQRGYDIAKLGMALPISNDFLFPLHWINHYGLPLEASICAYWTGNYEECQKISMDLLERTDLPDNFRSCIQSNLEFANAKIQEKMNDLLVELLAP